ncbi:MAG: hypothetical protein K2K25_08055, partial [Muribaculaceae bacterium]|nr:hypothetical protein [Muribaculaceae bacterium]
LLNCKLVSFNCFSIAEWSELSTICNCFFAKIIINFEKIPIIGKNFDKNIPVIGMESIGNVPMTGMKLS